MRGTSERGDVVTGARRYSGPGPVSFAHSAQERLRRLQRYERYSHHGHPSKNWLLFSTCVLMIIINGTVAVSPYFVHRQCDSVVANDAMFTESDGKLVYGTFDASCRRWVKGSFPSSTVSSWIPSNLIS